MATVILNSINNTKSKDQLAKEMKKGIGMGIKPKRPSILGDKINDISKLQTHRISKNINTHSRKGTHRSTGNSMKSNLNMRYNSSGNSYSNLSANMDNNHKENLSGDKKESSSKVDINKNKNHIDSNNIHLDNNNDSNNDSNNSPLILQHSIEESSYSYADFDQVLISYYSNICGGKIGEEQLDRINKIRDIIIQIEDIKKEIYNKKNNIEELQNILKCKIMESKNIVKCVIPKYTISERDIRFKEIILKIKNRISVERYKNINH